MVNRLARFVATFGYVGEIPLAPGSIASMAGILIYVALTDQLAVYAVIWLAVTLLGFWASGPVEKLSGKKDPSCIVIDEVSGVMIAFFMLPINWAVIFTGFFVFRAFDMFKIYPANVFEKRPGGVGVMVDDIVAGIYTNIIMHLAIFGAGKLEGLQF